MVYESGRSVFDESVLVYLVRSRRYWADFDVVDHVGRPLAGTRLDGRSKLFSRLRTTVLLDPAGGAVFEVVPAQTHLGSPFRVRGVTDARLDVMRLGFRGVRIKVGGEGVGSVVGTGLRGVRGARLGILNSGQVQVGTIEVFRRWGIWSSAADMVVSVGPGLEGDLRRIVPIVPIVLANLRQALNSSS